MRSFLANSISKFRVCDEKVRERCKILYEYIFYFYFRSQVVQVYIVALVPVPLRPGFESLTNRKICEDSLV